MIVNGGSRSNGAFFARHLMRTDHNDRVGVVEIRGLTAQTVRAALHEMAAIASGTRTTNYLYHAHLNPRESEQLTPEQWDQAADILERRLGLTDQPRLIVEHEKQGRTHRHIIWSRIDSDRMTAISDALTYRKHEQAAREIEQQLGHAPVASVLVKDRPTPRPARRPQGWESFRGQQSQRDPQAIKIEVTALWEAADSGTAFAAALAQRGYILARGDRRDFCIIDAAGDEHSLARRLVGVKAADIRTRLADIDRAALPSVAEARALARPRPEGAGGAAPVPVSVSDPRTDAAAQVRAVADAYRTALRPPARASVPQAPYRFAAPADADQAAHQLRLAIMPFVRALRRGLMTQLVAEFASDGLSWWQRAACYLEALADELHDSFAGGTRAPADRPGGAAKAQGA